MGHGSRVTVYSRLKWFPCSLYAQRRVFWRDLDALPRPNWGKGAQVKGRQAHTRPHGCPLASLFIDGQSWRGKRPPPRHVERRQEGPSEGAARPIPGLTGVPWPLFFMTGNRSEKASSSARSNGARKEQVKGPQAHTGGSGGVPLTSLFLEGWGAGSRPRRRTRRRRRSRRAPAPGTRRTSRTAPGR
jgi:hypothetical protein